MHCIPLSPPSLSSLFALSLPLYLPLPPPLPLPSSLLQDGKVDFEQFKSMMKEGVEREGISLKSGVALSELTESRLGELYICKANFNGGRPH